MTDGTGANDEPTNRDLLSIERHVKGLASFVRTCEMPLTVAVQGDWGSGKTTFLNLLETELKDSQASSAGPGEGPEGQVVVARFVAWQAAFQADESSTFVALIATIVEQIEADAPEDVRDRLRLKSGHLLESIKTWIMQPAVLAAGAGFVADTYLPGSGEWVKAVATPPQPQMAPPLPPVTGGAAVRRDFTNLVEGRFAPSGERRGRLVVFVDNLDRLRPARAVEVMECLKAVLDAPHCVFVVAIDFDVVVQGLAVKYPHMGADKARSFFDKLIQVPFQVPVNSHQLDGLITTLFREVRSDTTKTLLPKVEEIIDSSVGNNPRAIKRLANSYRLVNLIAEPSGTHEELNRGMLAQAALQIAYPDVHRYLDESLEQATDGLLKIIEELAKSKADSPDSIEQDMESVTQVAVAVADDWVIKASAGASAAAMSHPAPPLDPIGDPTSALARRRQSQAIERLAGLLNVLADVFGTGGNLDSKQFEDTWRLVSITSAESSQPSYAPSGLSAEEIRAVMSDLSVPEAFIAETDKLLKSWEVDFSKRGGRLHTTRGDAGLRIGINMPGRGAARKVAELKFDGSGSATVKLSGWNFRGEKSDHAAAIKKFARELELPLEHLTQQNAYVLRGVTAGSLQKIEALVPTLLQPSLVRGAAGDA